MQDLKRNKRKMMNKQMQPMANKVNSEEKYIEEELTEELSRACGGKSKPQHHHEHGCNTNHHHCDCGCTCGCNTKPECEPCEIDTKECIDNNDNCGPECCNPILPQKFSTANSVPYAIEANRIYDTMVFQTFTDAVAPNGEALDFDYDVIEVNGPVPKVGQVNVTIEEICINYSGIVIDTGNTTLEDYDLQPLEPTTGRPCETKFEYAVCGERNATCCQQGKGTNVVYKQRGLSIIVEDLVLELKGKCGCTEIIALAYPSVKGAGGQKRKCGDVEFIFNTLSSPICVPSDGRNVTLRQDYQTNLTVDCIGKAFLKHVDHDGCHEGHYHLCIPNDIDLILCLQCTVSTIINEQLVVLGAPNAIQPRIVDTFNKVCDFKKCGPEVNPLEDKNGHCGCKR
ncbi:hypothetical protein [Romboutsia sp.]|uniref:hypothetical protein n=1 Tax=Romboutsia sp. TaxID=1965302 RepID=UPI002CDA713A|nr:hypothetical protein [Romboutsia sp.]HSQ88157.1 hypothetical protein [Romboutsia sp.]